MTFYLVAAGVILLALLLRLAWDNPSDRALGYPRGSFERRVLEGEA